MQTYEDHAQLSWSTGLGPESSGNVGAQAHLCRKPNESQKFSPEKYTVVVTPVDHATGEGPN